MDMEDWRVFGLETNGDISPDVGRLPIGRKLGLDVVLLALALLKECKEDSRSGEPICR